MFVIALSLLPPVQTRGKALAVLAESLGLPFPRPFAPSVARAEVSLGGVEGDLYVPPYAAPGVVLVHGATEQGKDDPRLIRAARAMARGGRVVFVPALELAQRRFEDEDLERIVASVQAISGHRLVRGPVTLLGISYGGSFALVAAADPRLAGRIGQVAVFGAYFDLVGVIQATTTGVSLVGDDRIGWRPDPQAQRILRDAALELVPPDQRKPLESAIEGDRGSSELPDAARRMYDVLTNRDPARTYSLVERLPEEPQEMFRRFSPSEVADRITAPVVAMHSRDDPAVPYGEALRLVRGLPGTRLASVGSFSHVELEGGWLEAAGDLWHAWRFATWVLEAQE
ncbi:MAG: alpha/beta hydrolase family protein [Actinomycetota bacterium]